MRLAFLTSLVPTGHPDTGFEIANECLLDALADAGAEVTIFGFRRKSDAPDPKRRIVSLSDIEIETAKAGLSTRLGWIATSLRTGLPLSSAKLRRLPERELIARIELEGPFDGVIVNTAQMAGAFPAVMRRWPAILVAHNVEHASARENADHSDGLLRHVYRREAALLKRMESRAIAAACHVFFLSEEDRAVLAQGHGSSSVLALQLVGAMPKPALPAKHDVGLIGTWTWRPNLVGLNWFLEDVVPLLPESVSIAVAGRLPADMQASSPNVRLLGLVPDASAFVNSCRLMALTSRIGTGVQLKTIELMQLGWPAVATPSSLRGISFRPDNLIEADTAELFAKAIMSTLARHDLEPSSANGNAFRAVQKKLMQAAVHLGLDALRGQILATHRPQ